MSSGNAPSRDEAFVSDFQVSVFNDSVEDHLGALDRIAKLCGEPEGDSAFEKTDIERCSSKITFIREWRQFEYKPRTIRFAHETAPETRVVVREIEMLQLSAATVPKGTFSEDTAPISRKDFVLYVGGSIWALDWCPRVPHRSDRHIRSEFIAVAAHPPESSYHKIGVRLSGRGMIQIWGLLDVTGQEEEVPVLAKRKGRPKSISKSNEEGTQPKRPRGRPRIVKVDKPKRPIGRPRKMLITLNESTSENVEVSEQQLVQDFQPKRPKGRPRKQPRTESEPVRDSDMVCEKQLVQVLQPGRPKGRPRKQVVNLNEIKENDMVCDDKLVSEHQLVQVLQLKRPKGRPRKGAVNSNERKGNDMVCDGKLVSEHQLDQVLQSERPKRRPRKNQSIKENDMVSGDELVQALAVEYPRDASELQVEVTLDAARHVPPNNSGKQQKDVCLDVPLHSSSNETKKKLADNTKARSSSDNVSISLLAQDKVHKPPSTNVESNHSCELALPIPNEKVPDNFSSEFRPAENFIPLDLALPRVVLCLAHNGKVAWDLKWRPCNADSSDCKTRMGYLAVLLGNGSLEVWDVPSVHIVKHIYFPQVEGTDPRFVKLEPVFRCSKLMCGDRQSIPLTLEWSTSPPYDLILAGCHDGTVALWRFSTSDSSEDRRPFLCFSADTSPIRVVAWAPAENEHEASNVIVTAGHEVLKFWDIRDPFRPLWDLNHAHKVIYSLDWLPYPRCILVTFDDGTLKILSIVRAALDVPVTGKSFDGSHYQGLHGIGSVSFSIWSIQASRTGRVAYCNADGTAFNFQLTRGVEKDPVRTKIPHFPCGSLIEEESVLTVYTPLPGIPWNKSHHEQKAKDGDQDDQILALRYGDVPEVEPDAKGATPSNGRQASKSKGTGKNSAKGDRTLVSKDNGSEEMEMEGVGQHEHKNRIQVFPPKNVALHKVRWNMNKGSGRWLCYGGAAGILRCQETVPVTANRCTKRNSDH